MAKAKNDKAAAGAVMDIVKMDKEKFRLGHTKVFFRAGQLGEGWFCYPRNIFNPFLSR